MLEKLNLTLESVYIATNRVTEREWEKKSTNQSKHASGSKKITGI